MADSELVAKSSDSNDNRGFRGVNLFQERLEKVEKEVTTFKECSEEKVLN